MTKKDYKLIAECLNKAWRNSPYLGGPELIGDLVEDLCAELKRGNARFDKDKFVEAVYKDVGATSSRVKGVAKG